MSGTRLTFPYFIDKQESIEISCYKRGMDKKKIKKNPTGFVKNCKRFQY